MWKRVTTKCLWKQKLKSCWLKFAHNRSAFIDKKTAALKTKQSDLQKVQQEINKMKVGSVALIGQITTISKIRIVDPVNIHGALNGIKLSSTNLDLIDDKIRELFLHDRK